ncbi:MAG: DUF4164 domain-containing protein [Alphaproteobacteria bacterium]|nr:DUF4164 domain-containing protein [Alphaproteobacteria bacterium]
MTIVDDANQRLDAALSRLEAVMQTHLAAPDKVSAAQADRARLEQEMGTVRSEYASLKETSTQVSQRLDAAIGKVKTLLAE